MTTNRIIGTVALTGLALAFSVPLFLTGCGPKAEKEIQQVGPDIPSLKVKAEKGDPAAQCSLGMMFAKGEGVPKDDAEAARWFRKSAEQGWAPAQIRLGKIYANGDGVAKDLVQALNSYRKAAEQGDPQAQLTLGQMFAAGNGVPTNNVTAYLWFDLAGRNVRDAVDRRTMLAKQMTPEQIAEARRLSAQSVPRKTPPPPHAPW